MDILKMKPWEMYRAIKLQAKHNRKRASEIAYSLLRGDLCDKLIADGDVDPLLMDLGPLPRAVHPSSNWEGLVRTIYEPLVRTREQRDELRRELLEVGDE